eukprot:tig00000823_g4538.t1
MRLACAPRRKRAAAPPLPAPLLGLAGVTINSMALIAPGAFLWTTYALNLACIDNQGNSFAKDTFVGIIFAVWVAFMTAFPFAELAHVYPEAGAGGAYYFAERAFKHCRYRVFRPWSSLMKWYMGFSIHLFYWVYPGVTTALMSQVIVYLINTSPGRDPTNPLSPGAAAGIAIMCAAIVAGIAMKGINFSTNFNICVVIMQSAAIFLYGVLWAAFRDRNAAGPPEVAANPTTVATALIPAGDTWLFEKTSDIFKVNSGLGMVYQSSIAILILVGFDSSTQLGGETKKPERNVAVGCVLSLALQALLSYPFEYVSASAAMPASFRSAGSMAPIGDLTIVAGNYFGLNGYALMCIQAVTVLLSIFGTTLAASNAAVRVSLFMATERQFPSFMCRLHPTWRTPWVGLLFSFFINCVLGIACVANKDAYNNTIAITAVTMASNVGTFLLYAGICFTCMVNFAGKPHFNWWRHGVVPGVGMLLNLLEIFVIYIVAIMNYSLPAPLNASAIAAFAALAIVLGWLAAYVTIIYFGTRGYYGHHEKKTGAPAPPRPAPPGPAPSTHASPRAELDDWSVRAQHVNALPTAVAGHEHARPEEDWSVRDPDGSISKLRGTPFVDGTPLAGDSIRNMRELVAQAIPPASPPSGSGHGGAHVHQRSVAVGAAVEFDSIPDRDPAPSRRSQEGYIPARRSQEGVYVPARRPESMAPSSLDRVDV